VEVGVVLVCTEFVHLTQVVATQGHRIQSYSQAQSESIHRTRADQQNVRHPLPFIVVMAYSYWMNLDQYISCREAAQSLGVGMRRVQALIASGRLAALKIGRDWFIRPENLEAVRERKPGRPPKIL
jgi:excisionase family DNA binding protein